MHRCLFALTLPLAMTAAVAQGGDPLESSGCRHALAALQAQEAQLAAEPEGAMGDARRRAAQARLEPLQRRAAQACLGSRADRPAPARRFGQPPMAVPPQPTRPPPAPRVVPPRPAANPPRPAQVAPLVTVTSCDAAGCWASDGSRLQHAGPHLLGPRGLCNVVGSVLLCP